MSIERKCGNCRLRTPEGICQVFREPMPENELGCPKIMFDVIPCGICGQPIIGQGGYVVDDPGSGKWIKACDNCCESWGRCPTCATARTCDFETNPINIPAQITKTIQQGPAIMQTVIRNPEREAETCAKNCACWDDEMKMCLRTLNQGCHQWSSLV